MQDGSFGVQKGQFLGSCQLTEGIFTPPGTANSSPGRTPGQNQPSTNAFGLSAGTSYPGQLAMMNSSMFTSASSAPSVVDSVPSFSHVAFPPSLSLSGPNSNSFSSGVSSLRMAPTVTAAQMLDSREVNPFFATNPFPPRMDPFLALQQQAMQQQALQARLQNPQHPQLQQQRAEMAQMVAALRQQEEARMSSLVAQTQDPRTTANSIHTLMLQQQLQEQQQLQQFQQHQFSQMQKSVSRSPSDPSLSESSSQSFGFKNSLSSLSLTSLPGSAPLVQTGTTSPSLSAVSTRSASETPFDSQSDFTSQSATTTPAHPHYASPEVCAPLLGLSLGPSTPFLPSPSLPLSVDPTRCLEMSLASKAPLPPKSALFTTQSQSNTMSSMDAFSQFSLPFTSAYTVGTSAPLVGVSPPSQSPVNAKQALQLMISETSSSNDLKVDSSPHSSNSATNSARSSQAASSTKRRSVSASSDGVVDASYGAVRSVKQEQRRTPTTTNRKTPKGKKSTRAPENSFKSPILCGVLRPECKLSAEELSQQNAQSAELPIQHYREFSTLFNREVNVYTALRDPARRKLYQSSDLVRLLGVSNTYLAMHLSRRKKYRGAGIYQATVILQKQDSDKGIKTGGYFLSEEACLVFQSYWNNRGVMKLPASCSNVKKETK